MKLTFNRADVDKLLAHTKAASEHAPLYQDPKSAKPGLWLIGDDGVYLMSNGLPAQMAEPDKPESTRRVVVYAKQCDPTKMKFEAWWENKRRSFGGDDGSVFLPATAFDNIPDGDLAMAVSSKGIGVYEKPRPAPARPQASPTKPPAQAAAG
jgi:hypothetical protein